MNQFLSVQTAKGKTALYFNGFKYRLDSTHQSSQTKNWRCTNSDCSGRLITSLNNDNPRATKPHKHAPFPDSAQRDLALTRIKSRAEKETLSLPVIYKQELRKSTQELTASNSSEIPVLPSFYNLHSAIYRARRRQLPPLPKSSANLTIPNSLRKTNNGKEFVLLDGDKSGILLLATSENLQYLASQEKYFMDGTFDVAPTQYLQLFTMHAFINEKQLPLVFALLPDKSSNTYVQVFRHLRDIDAGQDIIIHPKVEFSKISPNSVYTFMEA